ncbi:Uncharacterised protein [BD1-7 clade bacterium]|uniref:VOC domain-containing protein n=1 Tax=BD1-7 clade bacterium TaxID=2029982 RepID=A0A5S9P4C5_9GAMM|nr:Uncharacterised protein [BD1-7 clade bacterium]
MILKTKQPSRHAEPFVKAQRLAYICWERPDLELVSDFLLSFGLSKSASVKDKLYFKGVDDRQFCYEVRKGSQPQFIEFGLEVCSIDDLKKLSELESASDIHPLNTPGGGYGVTLTDPAGHKVVAVCKQNSSPKKTAPPSPIKNSPGIANRINKTLRIPTEAPPVEKLGHIVFEVSNFQQTCEWYTTIFGFIPSDVQVLPDGSPAVVFMRLNLGDTPADHHTLALAQGVKNQFSHCAFEVQDEDAIGMGQTILREKNFKHAWGIGRHILGSQIFDYWEDPWGVKHEHYCDGDLFTQELPMGIHELKKGAMAQWGAPMPSSFVRPKITIGLIKSLLRNLLVNDDFSLRKLVMLLQRIG